MWLKTKTISRTGRKRRTDVVVSSPTTFLRGITYGGTTSLILIVFCFSYSTLSICTWTRQRYLLSDSIFCLFVCPKSLFYFVILLVSFFFLRYVSVRRGNPTLYKCRHPFRPYPRRWRKLKGLSRNVTLNCVSWHEKLILVTSHNGIMKFVFTAYPPPH